MSDGLAPHNRPVRIMRDMPETETEAPVEGFSEHCLLEIGGYEAAQLVRKLRLCVG